MISSVWIDAAALDDARQELRHVVPHVELAHVGGHPAPALHVDEDALDLGIVRLRHGCRLGSAVEHLPRAVADDAVGTQALGGLKLLHRRLQRVVVDVLHHRIGRRHFQPLAQQGDLRIGAARLENAAHRQLHAERRIFRRRDLFLHFAAAQLDQHLAQRFELLMLGMQRGQVRFGLLGRSDVGEHGLRRHQRRLLIHELRDVGRIDAAAAGKARVLEDGERHLDLGVGGGFRTERTGCGRRNVEGGNGQAPVFGAADLGDDGLALVGQAARRHPERGAGDLAVVRGERCGFLLVGLLGEQWKLGADAGNDRIGRRHDRRRRGSGRRTGGRVGKGRSCVGCGGGRCRSGGCRAAEQERRTAGGVTAAVAGAAGAGLAAGAAVVAGAGVAAGSGGRGWCRSAAVQASLPRW